MTRLRLAPLVLLHACGWVGGTAPESSQPSDGSALPDATTAATHLAPRPTDARPAAHGSAAGSLAARPSWSIGDLYAPSVDWDEARHLFRRGRTDHRSAGLEGELLACEVLVEFTEIKNWSLRPSRWKNADLAVHFSFGPPPVARKDHPLFATGPNQSNSTWIVAPVVRLRAGDPIDVLLNDRDRLLARDYVDRVVSEFDGQTPFRLQGDRTSIECRTVDPAVVDEVLLARLWEIDERLLAWSRADPDSPPDRELQRAMERAAGLVGWDDERIARRMGAGATIELRHLEQGARRFAELAAGVPRAGAPVELRGVNIGLRVRETTCDVAALARVEAEIGRIDGVEPCVITIELANRGAARQVWPTNGPDPSWTWRVLDARGRRMNLSWLERGPVTVPANATVELHAITGSSIDGMRWFRAPDEMRAPPMMLEVDELVAPQRRVRLGLR